MKRELNYPFDEFPEDLSTWESCKKEYIKLLELKETIEYTLKNPIGLREYDVLMELREIYERFS